MSAASNIEWTDSTHNAWEGCQKVGPGCDHCYAERRNARFGSGTAINWGPGAPRRLTSQHNRNQLRKWDRQHEAFLAEHGRRQRVFCSSLSDVFDNAVDPSWRNDLFAEMAACTHLDLLVLTKRVGNVVGMVPDAWTRPGGWPAHVRIGATIVNQGEADRDLPKLLALPCANFVSMEPLLGPVDLCRALAHPGRCSSEASMSQAPVKGLDWVIVGGESGPGARPMHPAWARDLRDQCATAGVPFMFKQWGEWLPGSEFTQELSLIDRDPAQSKFLCATWHDGGWTESRLPSEAIHFRQEPMYRVGVNAAGRELDGVRHDGVPTTPHHEAIAHPATTTRA
ncbi:phage Gp37/Gp68 family protein [Variovorax sp. LT1P1]|uniref:phage Gp37/Gp68 family protein n=1 Tax=Variovorax sp. LT1P1 TaxID=3443730 RepID=UPI003F462E01